MKLMIDRDKFKWHCKFKTEQRIPNTYLDIHIHIRSNLPSQQIFFWYKINTFYIMFNEYVNVICFFLQCSIWSLQCEINTSMYNVQFKMQKLSEYSSFKRLDLLSLFSTFRSFFASNLLYSFSTLSFFSSKQKGKCKIKLYLAYTIQYLEGVRISMSIRIYFNS